METRSNTEVTSLLPTYTAKPSQDHPGWLVVICPYEDCGDSFLVRAKTWRRKLIRVARTNGQEYEITGRSCPYCFRAAHIPRGRRIR